MVHVSVGGRMEMPEMSLWIIAEGSRERWTLKANACPHKNKWKGRTFRGYRGHHLTGFVGSIAGAHMEWVIRVPSPEACRKEASSERHCCQKMDAFRKSTCKAKAVTTSKIARAWMLWVLEEMDCHKPDPGCWWNSMLGGEDKSKISVVFLTDLLPSGRRPDLKILEGSLKQKIIWHIIKIKCRCVVIFRSLFFHPWV